MALTLTTNAPNFPFQIIAKDAAGGVGAPLPVDASGVTVTADKPEVGVISLDPNPVAVANPFDPASGTKSIASGVVRPLAAGTATATATVVGSDGNPLVTVTDSLTVVEPSEGTAAWAGTFFGASAPVALPAPGAAAPASHSGNPAVAHTSHPGNAGEPEHKKPHKS